MPNLDFEAKRQFYLKPASCSRMSFVRKSSIILSRVQRCIAQPLQPRYPVQWHRRQFSVASVPTSQCDYDPGSKKKECPIDVFDTLEKLFRGIDGPYQYNAKKKGLTNITQLGYIKHLNESDDTIFDDKLEEMRHEIQSELRDIQEKLTIVISRREFRTFHEEKQIRGLIRRHLNGCTTVKDIQRVIAVAVQRRITAEGILDSWHTLCRAFYRARELTSDERIASAMVGLVAYFHILKAMIVPVNIATVAIKFAMRSRNLTITRRLLWEFKRQGWAMNHKLFRSIIAKCSIGRRGFGEVRNGRWKKSDLLAVLLGPLHDEVRKEPHHLETFLKRNDWQYLHGWIVILSRCRAKEQLWKEWELWRDSSERRNGDWPTAVQYNPDSELTFRRRGDNWFVRHLLLAGDPRAAWKVFGESGMDFFDLSVQVRSVLLENLEFRTSWNERMEKELLKKYEEDLDALERRLGVKWVSGNPGYHLLDANFQQKLEELTRPEYFRVYGYFTEDEYEVKEEEHNKKG